MLNLENLLKLIVTKALISGVYDYLLYKHINTLIYKSLLNAK
jgi:hypothetical protein